MVTPYNDKSPILPCTGAQKDIPRTDVVANEKQRLCTAKCLQPTNPKANLCSSARRRPIIK
ncbi:hypothetical protein H0H92_003828, partial [Tricholoma furcatifolium]